MFPMHKFHVKLCVLWTNADNLVLSEKNLKTRICLITLIFRKLVWDPKIVKTYVIVMQWIMSCLQFSLKQATVKHHTENFSDFSDIQS